MLQLSKVDWPHSLDRIGPCLVVLAAAFWGRSVLAAFQPADPLNGLKPGVYHSTQTVSGDTLAPAGSRPAALILSGCLSNSIPA